MTKGERPKKKNIESLDLILLRLWCGKYFLGGFDVENKQIDLVPKTILSFRHTTNNIFADCKDKERTIYPHLQIISTDTLGDTSPNRHDRYSQIANPKFLVTWNDMKKR